MPELYLKVHFWISVFKPLEINECSLSIANCHPNASCIDTFGSFLCTCDRGYTGSGTVCEGKVISENLTLPL